MPLWAPSSLSSPTTMVLPGRPLVRSMALRSAEKPCSSTSISRFSGAGSGSDPALRSCSIPSRESCIGAGVASGAGAASGTGVASGMGVAAGAEEAAGAEVAAGAGVASGTSVVSGTGVASGARVAVGTDPLSPEVSAPSLNDAATLPALSVGWPSLPERANTPGEQVVPATITASRNDTIL